MAKSKKSTDKETGEVRRGKLRVRATEVGYYNHIRRRVGDVFDLVGVILEDGTLDSFSPRWMEAVSPKTEEKITTGVQELRRQHDEILATRVQDRAGDNPLGSD